MSQGIWILERCASERFPYRLRIERDGRDWLVLRAQDKWPAANRNIFCLREKLSPREGEVLEEVERVLVKAIDRRGIRLSVVLDRKRYKRCDFLFLEKEYKGRPGETYEQIFWITQASMRQRRPRARLALRPKTAFKVRVDSRERYPWRFPQAETERGPLPVGDYALIDGDEILAVIERKTLENLLADLSTMPILHQALTELATYKYNALVIEAPYADLLNPKKVHHYTPGFCARAIAELHALHPGLRIVFCANRKTANHWAVHYLSAVWALAKEDRPSAIPELL